MEVAARELIPALSRRRRRETRFTAFVNREAAAAGDGPWGELLPAVTVPVQARNRVQWVLGEQALLPRLAARERVELVHSLASTAPLWGRFRRVVTVHDLIYARFPEAHAGIRDKGMRVLVPRGARRSDRVIADSQSTREDLDRAARRRPRARSTSCRSALGAVQREPAAGGARARARASSSASAPVLLSLSAKRPHKNLAALIDALARDPRRAPPAAGAAGLPDLARAASCASARSLAGVADDVRFLGLGRPPRSSRACGRSRRRSCSRRCTRASGCRCWRRWRAACRWPARTPPRCPRSRATPRCCSTRTTRRAIADAIVRHARLARGGWPPARARPGSARAGSRWERTARLTLAELRARDWQRRVAAGVASRAPALRRSPAPCAARTPATAARRSPRTSARCSRAAPIPASCTRTIAVGDRSRIGAAGRRCR